MAKVPVELHAYPVWNNGGALPIISTPPPSSDADLTVVGNVILEPGPILFTLDLVATQPFYYRVYTLSDDNDFGYDVDVNVTGLMYRASGELHFTTSLDITDANNNLIIKIGSTNAGQYSGFINAVS